jgi:hypothetical protein
MTPFFIFLVIVVIVALLAGNAEGKKLLQAKQAYLSSLENLKKEPRNADLRQKTLELGRTYSNLTRDSKGVTMYDEMALMNDIGAACAAATATEVPSISTQDRINTLISLREQGIIDEDEFKERKKAILDSI